MSNSRGTQLPLSHAIRAVAGPLFVWVIVCTASAGSSLANTHEIHRETLDTPLSERGAGGPSADLSPAVKQRLAELKKEQLELAERVMKELPGREQSLVLMGDVHSSQGNTSEAVEFWNKAIAVNPKRPDIYNSIALVDMGKGQYYQAIASWRKALQIDPNMPQVRSGIARALMAVGKHNEAIEELEEDVQIYPDSAFSRFLLGQAYLQQKDYDKARENYEAVIELEPNNTSAYYGLFTACSRLKQDDKAREYMAAFKKRKAEDMKTLKKRNEAYDDLAMTRQKVTRTYIQAGQIYLSAGQVQKAEAQFDGAVTLDPNDTACLGALASLYSMTNRPSQALWAHRRISEIEPDNPVCHLNIGVMSARLKRPADAEQAFRRAVALAPNSSAAYRELARLYLDIGGNLAEARKLADKAVTLEAIGVNYLTLSRACDMSGDKECALAAIQKAIELEPDNPRYRQIYEYIRGNK